MNRAMLNLYGALFLGIVAGVAWALTGLAVNTLHLVVGSLVVGTVMGNVATAVFLRRRL